MQLDQETMSRLIPFAGVTVPLGAVVAARVFLSAGPSAAPAASFNLPPQLSPVSAPAAEFTEAQQAALEYLSGLATAPTSDSPMAVPVGARPAEPDSLMSHPVDIPAIPESPIAHLVLNSVAGTGDRVMASINNRVYRVGQEPVPGWVVRSIDTKRRTVVLGHSSGAVGTLSYGESAAD